jgi:predicted transcriptional regulator
MPRDILRNSMDIGLNLDSESVQQCGPQEPLCVSPETTVREVLGLLKQHGRGSLLVCRENRLVGIFTERDALRLLARRADLDVAVAEVMTADPVTVRPDDALSTAVARMSSHGYRRLPMVDPEGHPLGVLDAVGVVHWLVQHFPEAVYNLPPDPRPASREREGP